MIRILSPPLKVNEVTDLCQKIAGLQTAAKKQAEEVSTHMEDPSKLIAMLRDQVKTVASLQKCVSDLTENKEDLTASVLDQLKKTFKELADLTEQNHQEATRKGIRLTPKLQPDRSRRVQRKR